jgi:hypothetical protein
VCIKIAIPINIVKYKKRKCLAEIMSTVEILRHIQNHEVQIGRGMVAHSVCGCVSKTQYS